MMEEAFLAICFDHKQIRRGDTSSVIATSQWKCFVIERPEPLVPLQLPRRYTYRSTAVSMENLLRPRTKVVDNTGSICQYHRDTALSEVASRRDLTEDNDRNIVINTDNRFPPVVIRSSSQRYSNPNENTSPSKPPHARIQR
jgi:hypothetical protein